MSPCSSHPLGCAGLLFAFPFRIPGTGVFHPCYTCLRRLSTPSTRLNSIYASVEEDIVNMTLHTQTTLTDTHEEKQKSGFRMVLQKFKASFTGKNNTPSQSSKYPPSPSDNKPSCTTSVSPTNNSFPSRPASQPIRQPQATPRTSSQAARRPASSLTKYTQQSHHHSRPSSIRASLSRTSRHPPPSSPDLDLPFAAPTTQTIIHSPLDKRNHRSSISSPALTLRRSYLNSKQNTALVECVSSSKSQREKSGAGSGMRKSGRSIRECSQPQPQPRSNSHPHSQSTSSDAASVVASDMSKESKVRFSLKVGSMKMMREEGEFEKGGGWTG
ncbi:hypothetical protein NX059_003502 [Plenodomus lindquistii]|nr:hypothetical protein NX059_003502 [Plenodomus lindquistii]